MGMFGKRRGSRLPADTVARMTKLGKFEMNPSESGIGGSELFGDCISPYTSHADQDPAGFVADLHGQVISHGGLAAFGASRLVVELLQHSMDDDQNYLDLLDAGLDYKRGLGLPSAFLNEYEMRRWNSVHGPATR